MIEYYLTSEQFYLLAKKSTIDLPNFLHLKVLDVIEQMGIEYICEYQDMSITGHEYGKVLVKSEQELTIFLLSI